MTELTRDTPAPGVVVWQPRRGYRYGVEVYALAAFALGGGAVRSAVDLGCGSGVVGLLLASRGIAVRAIEREPRWVALARRNAEESGLALAVEEADVRGLAAAGTGAGEPVDLAVSNPPWFPADQPRAPDAWKAASRSMLHGGVAAFAEAGLRLAPRVCLVVRREREADVAGVGGIARRAALGERIVLLELRAGACETRHEILDLPAAYGLFGR